HRSPVCKGQADALRDRTKADRGLDQGTLFESASRVPDAHKTDNLCLKDTIPIRSVPIQRQPEADASFSVVGIPQIITKHIECRRSCARVHFRPNSRDAPVGKCDMLPAADEQAFVRHGRYSLAAGSTSCLRLRISRSCILRSRATITPATKLTEICRHSGVQLPVGDEVLDAGEGATSVAKFSSSFGSGACMISCIAFAVAPASSAALGPG